MLTPVLFTKWIVIAVNRIASWFGAGYFVRKGYKYKKRRYWAVALLISVVMFLSLVFFLHRLPRRAELKQETPGRPLSR